MSVGTTVEAIRPISDKHARRLGANRWNCLKIARSLRRRGIINKDMTSKEIATAIAVEIAAKNADEMELCATEDKRDWASFFEALIAFIEKILPLIMMFMG
ncbi:MAG: hypothetical protein WC455_11415 [Dehalococcoidia bacterium]|jgi:hypothetical protein